MGFLNTLLSGGKAALKAVNDAALKKTLESYEKMSRAPKDRVIDFYEQYNKNEGSSSFKRGLAIAALQDRSLFEKDEDARRSLTNLRKQLTLENSRTAKKLMEAIDNLNKY